MHGFHVVALFQGTQGAAHNFLNFLPLRKARDHCGRSGGRLRGEPRLSRAMARRTEESNCVGEIFGGWSGSMPYDYLSKWCFFTKGRQSSSPLGFGHRTVARETYRQGPFYRIPRLAIQDSPYEFIESRALSGFAPGLGNLHCFRGVSARY